MSRSADFFNQWYAEMGCSARRDQIARRALGLPSDMDASGVLPRRQRGHRRTGRVLRRRHDR